MKAVVLLFFFFVCRIFFSSSFLGFFVMTYSYCGFKGVKPRSVLTVKRHRKGDCRGFEDDTLRMSLIATFGD